MVRNVWKQNHNLERLKKQMETVELEAIIFISKLSMLDITIIKLAIR